MCRTLAGRAAIITGAGDRGGIGFGIAQVMAEKGARLMLFGISAGVHANALMLRESGFDVVSETVPARS